MTRGKKRKTKKLKQYYGKELAEKLEKERRKKKGGEDPENRRG